MISFTEPVYSKKSLECIQKHFGEKVSYKKKVIKLVKDRWKFNHVILTTSCTHALEAMAMILNIGPGDEVLIPSYTFVSTANAFVKFGASVKCIDSKKDNPNIDEEKICSSITSKTKALVIVHYAGVACEMEKIVKICKDNNIYLLEDAAQAINSYHKDIPLGSFGIMSAFSFHSTKNIGCGEGGMLVINDSKLIDKAEIIVEKGTNRHNFLSGKIDKYEWIDKGSSYPMAEINAAFLYPQLCEIDQVTEKRKIVSNYYHLNISENLNFQKCDLGGNFHIYYLVFKNPEILEKYKKKLLDNYIQTSKHYNPIHKSKYYITNFQDNQKLPNSEKFGCNLLRLPLHNNLTILDCKKITEVINKI